MYALLLIINNIFGSLIILNCLLLLLPPSGKLFPKLSHLFTLGTQASSNSLNMYLFLHSELQLGKSKEINNQGIKVQVKIAFKSYSFIFVTKMQKKTKKKQTNQKSRQALHEIFFSLQDKNAEASHSPISTSIPPFFTTPSFSKTISTPGARISKMTSKHNVGLHPTLSG